MFRPEFTEALFEQCVNHELNARYRATIIGGIPTKPSQIAEALEGYDAVYQFTSGRQLFLQYKVARFVEKAWGTGAATYNLWAGPYFRSDLHWHREHGYAQHNTLVDLCRPPDIACYCAPLFYDRATLSTCYNVAGGPPGVLEKTLFAPLFGAERFNGNEAHSISYPSNGLAFRFQSEPSEYFEASTADRVLARAEAVEWTPQHFSELEERLTYMIVDHGVRVSDPPPADTALGRIDFLLRRYLSSVLVLVPG